MLSQEFRAPSQFYIGVQRFRATVADIESASCSKSLICRIVFSQNRTHFCERCFKCEKLTFFLTIRKPLLSKDFSESTQYKFMNY